MIAATASGEGLEKEVGELRDLVLELQDQVRTQQEEIAAQRSAPEETSPGESRASSSALSSFLEKTEFEGWVAASYFYNFNKPDDQHEGNDAIGNPFHANHNAFQFDEAWFAVDNAATAESPAGFHFEITYGATGGAFSNLINSHSSSVDDPSTGNNDGNDLWIPAAYVEYKTPIGPSITAGKFATTIGYEVAGAPLNVNITRGFVYNLLQPIDHIGVKVSNEYDSGLSWAVAAVNGFGSDQPEMNDDKGFLWSLGYGTDMFSASFNGIVLDPDDDTTYVLDLVLEANPADQVLVWLNFDYVKREVGGDEPWSSGVAVGSRFAISDNAGVGARFEYGRAEDDGSGEYTMDSPTPDGGGDGDLNLYSATLTGDWALTRNLTWKLEVQWQAARGDGDALFQKKNHQRENQFLFGTQLYYAF
jgi:hypothetical protein